MNHHFNLNFYLKIKNNKIFKICLNLFSKKDNIHVFTLLRTIE